MKYWKGLFAFKENKSYGRLQGKGRVSLSQKTSSILKSIIIPLTLTCFTHVYSGELDIDNVSFYERQDGQVIVQYDLIGKPGKKYTIVLSLFARDRQILIPLTKGAVFGDVGKNISPGRNKQIRWDLLQDKPTGLHGNNFVFVVDAYSQQKTLKSPILLGVLGAVGGGVTFLILNSDSSKPPSISPDLPGPPDLPGSP
jgi:hypothetical protein